MTNDEDFGRELRALAGRLDPHVAVETAEVIGRAHRRRALTWTGGGAALAVGVVAVGLVGATLPWSSSAHAGLPAGPGPVPVTSEAAPSPTGGEPAPSPGTGEPAPGPTASAGSGWPDAPYWHVVATTDDGNGTVHHEELWAGHTKPGLIVDDGDLADSTGIGVGLWGRFDIAGADTMITWDELYALPTDPTALGAVLAAGIDRTRGNGDDADREVSMIQDLLDRSPAPPALRQALWTVLAGLPRTTVTPGSTDSTGRTGTLIAHTGLAGEVLAWVYAPADGTPLELSEGEPGQATYRITYLEEEPTGTLPKEPSLADSGCASWATC